MEAAVRGRVPYVQSLEQWSGDFVAPFHSPQRVRRPILSPAQEQV